MGSTLVRSLGYYDINLVTPSYFACDANAVITEQLINLKSFNKNTHLTFPAGEGRGAVFSYYDVPFHRYNSSRGNDQLCEHMGMFTIDDSKHLWPIKSVPEGATVCPSLPRTYPSYMCFPSIESRLRSNDYHVVLIMPLSRYVLASLQYQRSLTVADRIKNETNQQATDRELDAAIAECISSKQIKTMDEDKGPSSASSADHTSI